MLLEDDYLIDAAGTSDGNILVLRYNGAFEKWDSVERKLLFAITAPSGVREIVVLGSQVFCFTANELYSFSSPSSLVLSNVVLHRAIDTRSLIVLTLQHAVHFNEKGTMDAIARVAAVEESALFHKLIFHRELGFLHARGKDILPLVPNPKLCITAPRYITRFGCLKSRWLFLNVTGAVEDTYVVVNKKMIRKHGVFHVLADWLVSRENLFSGTRRRSFVSPSETKNFQAASVFRSALPCWNLKTAI